MSATVVLGLAWGDEGKGRVCDALAADARYVARYSGGNNAGHTIRIGDEEFVVHLIPSGIVREGVVCTVGNGVVVNPEVLEQEVVALEKRGLSVRDRLKIDGRSHLILPYHILLDSHREKALGDAKIGTTNRGIGPAYEDKVARVGIRVQDVFDEGILRAKLKAALREKNSILENVYGEEPYDPDELAAYLLSFRELLGPMMADTGGLLREALEEGESILLEGAQATLLDNDHGTYPFVTSSNPTAGGAATGAGIGPNRIDRVIAIVKAYTTRVGAGPFPTELHDEQGEWLRSQGFEFGTTTGRPRRTGWYDAPIARYAARINGVTDFVMTKLDVLTGLERIPVCVAYQVDGKRVDEVPVSQSDFHHAKPVYEEFPGWDEDITGARQFSDLPKAAQNYVLEVEAMSGARISAVGVGPERDAVIVRHDLLN